MVKHYHNRNCTIRTMFPDGVIASFEDCSAQYQWNKKMVKLLAKEPKSMKGFSFMPKGEVT